MTSRRSEPRVGVPVLLYLEPSCSGRDTPRCGSKLLEMYHTLFERNEHRSLLSSFYFFSLWLSSCQVKEKQYLCILPLLPDCCRNDVVDCLQCCVGGFCFWLADCCVMISIVATMVLLSFRINQKQRQRFENQIFVNEAKQYKYDCSFLIGCGVELLYNV